MSNWPQRSVSASDQHWICFFGDNPEVVSEWSVSTITSHRFENRDYCREKLGYGEAKFTSI
jgi:hypothetical protein